MTEKYKDKYRVESTRLRHWDYSVGSYFVTICTRDKEHYFGNIIDGIMQLSIIGEIAKQELLKTEKMRDNVKLDEWVIMPNHIHVIIVIDNVETQRIASLRNNKQQYQNKFGPQSNNLASIIRGYKIGVKKWATINNVGFQWQTRFYDHIIRDENSLNNIREYIINNPLKWELDIENKINDGQDIKKYYERIIFKNGLKT